MENIDTFINSISILYKPCFPHIRYWWIMTVWPEAVRRCPLIVLFRECLLRLFSYIFVMILIFSMRILIFIFAPCRVCKTEYSVSRSPWNATIITITFTIKHRTLHYIPHIISRSLTQPWSINCRTVSTLPVELWFRCHVCIKTSVKWRKIYSEAMI